MLITYNLSKGEKLEPITNLANLYKEILWILKKKKDQLKKVL